MEAQFRACRGHLEVGHGEFPDGTVGQTMVDTLTANLDALWDAYQAAGRSSKNGLGRARKALSRISDDASDGVRDWLIGLAEQIAAARRTVGEGSISKSELDVMSSVAEWLDRPLPDQPPD